MVTVFPSLAVVQGVTLKPLGRPRDANERHRVSRRAAAVAAARRAGSHHGKRPHHLVVGLLLGGIYGLVSIGLNLIFGVVRIVNFAQGEFVMLGMYGAYFAWHSCGIDPYVSACSWCRRCSFCSAC